MHIAKVAAVAAVLGCFSLGAEAQSVGDQQEINVGNLSTHAEWDQGTFKCNPQNSRADGSWAPGKGWAIISTRKAENEANNGGGEISMIDGGPTYPSVSAVSSQFSLLLGLARLTKNTPASQEIQAVQISWLKAREGVAAQNRTGFYVWANSHGNCADQKGGSANDSFFATVRYVGGDDDLTSVVNALRSKYFPDL